MTAVVRLNHQLEDISKMPDKNASIAHIGTLRATDFSIAEIAELFSDAQFASRRT
jgi:hypothetical protein